MSKIDDLRGKLAERKGKSADTVLRASSAENPLSTDFAPHLFLTGFEYTRLSFGYSFRLYRHRAPFTPKFPVTITKFCIFPTYRQTTLSP